MSHIPLPVCRANATSQKCVGHTPLPAVTTGTWLYVVTRRYDAAADADFDARRHATRY